MANDVLLAVVEGSRAGPCRGGSLSTATGTDLSAAQRTAAELSSALPPIDVATVDVGRERRTGLSQFSLVAPQQLVLFVFINSMASGAALVRMRRTGVLRRVLAGPGGTGTIVAGLLAVWVIISLFQSLLIIAVGLALGSTSIGAPQSARAALVFTFAVVGAGAGLMVGALGGNEDRVGAITPPIGIVLGAIGGCMVPLEVFSPTMRSVAHLVPQFWAMSAWQQLIFDGAGIDDIVGPLLACSLGSPRVFLSGAVWALHRSLLRGAT